MKKKILIVSLAVNIIAGAFVFYSFTSKEKRANDGGGGYITLSAYLSGSAVGKNEISVTDGNSILDKIDINGGYPSADKARDNSQAITKKMNDLKNQGYELISSNSAGIGCQITNYVFVKK